MVSQDQWAPEKVPPPSRRFRVEVDDGDDLGFVVHAAFGAVTMDEFQKWLLYLIVNQDDLPLHIFTLLDISHISDAYRVHDGIGFTPSWERTDAEAFALKGIGYRRFENYHTDSVGRQPALAALAANPHIEARFRETFPFIDW